MKYLVGAIALAASCLAQAGSQEEEVSDNILAMQNAYAAFASGDMEAWKAEHSSDVTWTILEGLPYSGTYQGKDAIIENVWGSNFVGDTNIVDVYIGYLRKKVERSGETQLIHTVRGVGFMAMIGPVKN